MGTKPKAMLGTMECLCCKETIPVKQAENGTLNAACPWCDFPAWAKAGTKAHALILARVKKPAGAAPAPAPTAAPAAPVPPAPAAKRAPASVFHLGD